MKSYLAASIQMWVGKDEEENLKRGLEKLDEAASKGAKLIVFPESVNCTGPYDSRQESFEKAVAIPGRFTEEICRKAATHGVYVAINLNEKSDYPRVYHTTILISSTGEIIGKYRKHLLWADETNCFSPDRAELPVFETELGRIGMYVCADGLIPETTRCLALNRAQVLVNMLASKGPDESMLQIPARSCENRIWIISANQVGQPGELRPHVGGGLILSPKGEVMAKASEVDEDIVYGTICPAQANDKSCGEHNDLFSDRRPDLYGLLSEATEKLPLLQCPQETEKGKSQIVKVAAIQAECKQDPSYTLERAIEISDNAASQGARILVLPELFLFHRATLSQELDAAVKHSQDALDQFRKLAKSHSAYVTLNLVEKEGEKFYNSAFLLDKNGEVCGKYRKTHLWGKEKEWAEPGDCLQVFPTEYGMVGIMIGYEALFPEIARVLTCMGANLILHPCTWEVDYIPSLTMNIRAAENHINIVSANRPDSPVRRGSMIITVARYPTQPHWKVRYPKTEEAPPGFEFYISIDLDMNIPRQKTIARNTDLIMNRYPELYEILTKPL
ncbi:carbon-nitrogen hydrolase family protein [Acidobacteria bacterium AH-259-D05]|nr:carbon-nitrogen hydrolase family protein [Acidobacteria bacterium AH-259-D05]